RYASLSRHPTVPAMARLRPLLQIRHLDPAQVILRDLVALCLDVDAEEAGGVQTEDLFLQRAGQRRVLVLLDEPAGDREAPERLDLPLRRPVPDRIGPPEHVVGAEGVDDLAEQVRAGGRVRRDESTEGGAELHVDIPEPRLLLLERAELGRPRDLARGLRGRNTEQA